jgi:hypothetical protein
MKYILCAAGLLLSINGFAADASGPSSAMIKKLSNPACKAFCDSYNQNLITCDVNIMTGTGSSQTTVPTDGSGASISGSSVSLNYSVSCAPK